LKVELISPSLCKRPDWHGKKVNKSTVLCAGHVPGGKGICAGDAGGPLQCRSDDGRWKLVGVTSWNTDCAVRQKPTVFIRIAAQLDWIRKFTNGMYVRCAFYRSTASVASCQNTDYRAFFSWLAFDQHIFMLATGLDRILLS